MRIVVAGGTGFLGSPLCAAFAEDGHDVRVLSRSLSPGEARHDAGTGVPGITRVGWSPDGRTGRWADAVSGADAVLNLAGTSIGGRRWTPQRKAELRDSRILATRSLASAIQAADTPPHVFVSASATGYYGARGTEPLNEATPPGHDFLATLCVDWEAEAHKAARKGLRLAVVRTGMVLERSGGALAEMIRPFRLGLGGPMGSGRQYVSWIHRLDWLEMVRWIVETPGAAGPINATAPHPVTSREFARSLGRAIRRPAILPAPHFALRLVLGEFADHVVTGQRVVPEQALSLGYRFRYPELDIALRGIFQE